MTGKKKQVKEYCDSEFENIDKVFDELFLIVKSGKNNYSIAELAAMASFLHSIYNGIENTLKRILIAQGIKLKDSPYWHRDLLQTSASEEIISETLHDMLLDYLTFRHYFIHAYSIYIEWERMGRLVINLPDTIASFKAKIEEYVERTF